MDIAERIGTTFLLACALHPDTWMHWVPEEITERIPLEVRCSISCTPNNIWIIADEQYNVLWSSEPVEIFNDGEETTNVVRALLRKVMPEPPPKAA